MTCVVMPEYSFILAGLLGVGKSSLYQRLQSDTFTDGETEDTHRYDMGLECFVYHTSVDGTDIKVTLWDTGGLERFDSMTANYYRNCNAVILTYDLTAESTLCCLETWKQEASKSCRWPQSVVFSLWGNKSDSSDEKTTDEVIDAFATNHEVPLELCFKVSALTGHMVKEAMEKLVRVVHERFSSPDFLNVSMDQDRDMERLMLEPDTPHPRSWCQNVCNRS